MPPVFFSNLTDRIVLVCASLLWFIPELILAHQRRPLPGARVQDRHSGTAVMAGIWLGMVCCWAAAITISQFAIRIDRSYLFAIGIGLMLAGITLRWYSIRILGRFFTVVVAVQERHTIVETGPYRLLRHPSYSGSLLTILGYALVFTNWLSLILAVLFPLLAYWYRMTVEEQALVGALGQDYRAYMKRTKRIIPFVI